MAKKKVCKNCKMFYEGGECPGCKSNQVTTIWKGRIHILDATKSNIAEQIGLEHKGEYAIKIR